MKHARSNRNAQLLCGAAAVALALGAGSARAETAEGISISPQPLSSALGDFAAKTHRAILVTPDLTAKKTTAGVAGAMDAETALTQVLAGTGLTYRHDGETFLIVKEDQDTGNVVQELVVTAQKKEEAIQTVPIAISAFTQTDLTTRQIAGGPDLMTQVPNFTFTKTNFTGYSIQIRGIGTQAISATTDAAVAVAFNNTPFIRNRFFEQEFYDLERVEVLRGPQGTLYGRNATAGVVNILSAKPTFDYDARVSADVSNYSSKRLETMVNVPLVDDKVALRVAGAWTKREGFDTNQITGSQIDGRDLWSTRVSLRFAPTDKVEANLIWEHFQENDDRLRSGKQLCHRDDRPVIQGYINPPINGYSALFNQGCVAASLYSPDSFEAPNGYSLPYYLPLGGLSLPVVDGFNPYASTVQSHDLRVIESTVDPIYRAKSDLAELQLRIDLPNHLTLTSETGYNADTLFSLEDYNRFNTASGAFNQERYDQSFSIELGRTGVLTDGVFCDPQIGCADRVVAVDVSTALSRQFSQEFRLSSDYDGKFNFSLGANFLRYDTEDKYYVFINTLSLYAALPFNGIGYMGPWIPGVTDNHECLKNGMVPPDPTKPQQVTPCIYIDPNPIGSLNDEGHNYFLSRNPYKLISYAVFGEAYYNITDSLKLTAGLRWTVDKKEAPRIPSWVLASETVGYPVAGVERQRWSEPTGRLTLDWKPDLGFTEQTLLYASYAHGYKAGGANPPPAGVTSYGIGNSTNDAIANDAQLLAATHPRTFEPEFVNAFEVGTKNTLLDGKLTLNGDAFYYDYTGYQISQIVDRSAINYNFDAKIWGLEFEGDWRPLRNLRLGLKLGYENTRVADGAKAVDVMDRTAGVPGWVVVRPFPSFTSNCILPLSVVAHGTDTLQNGQNIYQNGNMGYCEFAYVLGHDPLTNAPYVPNPTNPPEGTAYPVYPGYPGFDPKTAPNHGAGFYKDLSGNELPNAPHLTSTVTIDYTIPLPHDWLATLHTDLYRQSEAWTRIFNTPGYDRLKAYTNVNVAAIFSNERAGLKAMLYLKNVFNRDSITGAFLNSDDTGLTTNVFLTEPRLYGIRVTKDWTGAGPWWTGADPNHKAGEAYPLTIEIGGQIQRHDAPQQRFALNFIDTFPAALDPTGVQDRDLDWGDGREVKLTYAVPGSPWSVSAGVRIGKANSSGKFNAAQPGDGGCIVGEDYFPGACQPSYHAPYQATGSYLRTSQDWSRSSASQREEHTLADFAVGRDLGLGFGPGSKSRLSAGLRYADFQSKSHLNVNGVPDWYYPDEWMAVKYATHHLYEADISAKREFKGVGPTLSWNGSAHLFGDEAVGHVDADWSIAGGVLFGKQKTWLNGEQTATFYSGKYNTNPAPVVGDPVVAPVALARSKSVSVPLVDFSVGLSYEIQRIKVSTGYRWERYFNVLDGGYAQHRSYDRTLDGPYFKISLGFGG